MIFRDTCCSRSALTCVQVTLISLISLVRFQPKNLDKCFNYRLLLQADFNGCFPYLVYIDSLITLNSYPFFPCSLNIIFSVNQLFEYLLGLSRCFVKLCKLKRNRKLTYMLSNFWIFLCFVNIKVVQIIQVFELFFFWKK